MASHSELQELEPLLARFYPNDEVPILLKKAFDENSKNGYMDFWQFQGFMLDLDLMTFAKEFEQELYERRSKEYCSICNCFTLCLKPIRNMQVKSKLDAMCKAEDG